MEDYLISYYKKENFLNIETHIIFLGNRNDIYTLILLTVGVEAQANGLSCILSDQMIRETKMTENMEF